MRRVWLFKSAVDSTRAILFVGPWGRKYLNVHESTATGLNRAVPSDHFYSKPSICCYFIFLINGTIKACELFFYGAQ